jgi:hypothetical protein
MVLSFIVHVDTFAGPPLLCHPIEIGNAKSLPWTDGAWGTKKEFNLDDLVGETLNLLSPDVPILVRMETLRRATLYATKNLEGLRQGKTYNEEGRRIAYELLTRLMARGLDAASTETSDALAWFDAGYFMECCNQAFGTKELTGYRYVRKALSLRGEDPEMEFAAALITSSHDQNISKEHLQKALRGGTNNLLLSDNISIHFGKDSHKQ